MKNRKNKQNSKHILTICLTIIIVSLNLIFTNEIKNNMSSETDYKAVNTKNMALSEQTIKTGIEDTETMTEFKKLTILPTNGSNAKLTSTKLKESKSEPVAQTVTKPVWRKPVEIGTVTQTPSYYHPAYDITSWRGTAETIYPIADGVISSIYYDSAGALVVTVNHTINGINYTSQYVHMSSFAPGIYVGQPVTTDTPLGQMGSTGRSTGNHLHISLAECSIYNSNDYNCSDLGKFFNYLKIRYNQGFSGINNVMDIPWSWTTR